MRRTALTVTALLALPAGTALAQSGTTQSRDGLGNAAHPTRPANASPAGSENATSGPQSKPAYPSGSTTANPGAAFVRTKPVPSTGSLAKSPGIVSTTTFQGGKATTRPGSDAGREGAVPLPPK